jgi:hypothetical protein
MFQLALFNGSHELPTTVGILKKKTGYTRRSLENSLWRFHENKLVCQIQYKWLSKVNSLTVTHWAFIYNGKIQERVAFGKPTILRNGYEFDVIPEIEFNVLKGMTTRR